MTITFYKDIKIALVITDVHDFTKCSTGDVYITFNDGSDLIVAREQYNFFGATIK